MYNKVKNIEKDPLISVIIPCYNSEKTIKHTLSSLEKQTYDNFEVILINDGSKDNSDEIIKNYLSRSNIRCNYINQENEGVSVARNVGLKRAKGKYITFLDADDIYNQDFIKILTMLLNENEADTAYCCYSRDIKKIYRYTVEQYEKESALQNYSELMSNFMYRNGPCAFFTYIYKKSIIDEYNINFTENVKYGEDLEFTWKYLSHCKNGVFVNKHLYGYYDNPFSAVNNVNWNMTDALKSVKRVEEYMKKQNNPFYLNYKNYMYCRTMIAILKDFSIAKRLDLFERFIYEYNPKQQINKMVNQNFRIKILGNIFVVNSKMFYYLFSIYGFFVRRRY